MPYTICLDDCLRIYFVSSTEIASVIHVTFKVSAKTSWGSFKCAECTLKIVYPWRMPRIHVGSRADECVNRLYAVICDKECLVWRFILFTFAF